MSFVVGRTITLRNVSNDKKSLNTYLVSFAVGLTIILSSVIINQISLNSNLVNFVGEQIIILKNLKNVFTVKHCLMDRTVS